jgi:hypothetical protein
MIVNIRLEQFSVHSVSNGHAHSRTHPCITQLINNVLPLRIMTSNKCISIRLLDIQTLLHVSAPVDHFQGVNALPEDGPEGPKHVGVFVYLINVLKCIYWMSLFSILGKSTVNIP